MKPEYDAFELPLGHDRLYGAYLVLAIVFAGLFIGINQVLSVKMSKTEYAVRVNAASRYE
jgi:hypothetical protein